MPREERYTYGGDEWVLTARRPGEPRDPFSTDDNYIYVNQRTGERRNVGSLRSDVEREQQEQHYSQQNAERDAAVRGEWDPENVARQADETVVGPDGTTRTIANIPVAGQWSREQILQYRAQQDAARRDALVGHLARTAPTVDELTPDYHEESYKDEYGDLIGGPSEWESLQASGDQRYAREALRQLYQSGGYTDADASARRLAAMERGQQLRGANEAALQQMQARGMGGGGAELAARLSGSQALSQGQAMNDAAVQQAAMQRALQALQGHAAQSNVMQQQEMQRRAALDSFNQQNLDWRRSRQTRDWQGRNANSQQRANAHQQAYNNRENQVAMYTNNYNHSAQERREAAQRAQESDDDVTAFAGGLLS